MSLVQFHAVSSFLILGPQAFLVPGEFSDLLPQSLVD